MNKPRRPESLPVFFLIYGKPETITYFVINTNLIQMSASSDPKKFGFLFERTFRITKLSFIKVFSKLNVDITPDQWVLLDTLNSEGALSQKQISGLSFKDAATISRIIDKLEKKGFVTRTSEEKDRRKTTISLTHQGENVIQVCQNEIDKLRKHSWQNLTEEDYENFQRIMNQVFSNFDSYE